MTATTVSAALWRRRTIILLAVGIFLAAAAVVILLMPKRYEATATIFLDTNRNSNSFDTALQSNQILEHDLIVLATKRPVLLAACATKGVICTASELASPDQELSKRVAVNVASGTNLLAVTGRAQTPAQAAALANAVASAMIDQDIVELKRLFKPAEDALDTQLTQVRKAIVDEQHALGQAKGGALAEHQAALTRLTTELNTLLGRRQDLLIQHQRLLGIATVIEPATTPAKPSAPDPDRYLEAALIAGLAVGVLAALLRQRFDDRLFTPQELAAAAGTSTVVVIPRRPRNGTRLTPYALAHTRLLARYPQTRTFLVAAASSRDGSDAPAVGLAAAAAVAGQRVLLFRDNAAGQNGHADFTVALKGHAAGMTTMTVGSDDASSAELALAHANGQYDVIVLAAPSPESSPYTLSAARLVNHTVLVATAGVTRFTDARRSADLLREAGATVGASILVSKPRRGRGRHP